MQLSITITTHNNHATSTEAKMAGNRNYDFLMKLLIIGDSDTGKSSCLLRFAEDAFTPSYISTVGIDFKIRTIELDGKRIKLQIWDTAGQERFKTITRAYYRGAHGILIVFSVLSRDSFEHVKGWFSEVQAHGTGGVSMILVGNKCDDSEKRQVSTEEGQQLADELGLPFLEVSALSGVNVEKAFFTVAQDIKRRNMDEASQKAKEGRGVEVGKGEEKSGKCC